MLCEVMILGDTGDSVKKESMKQEEPQARFRYVKNSFQDHLKIFMSIICCSFPFLYIESPD